MPENILLAEFELFVDFERGTADPQRVFKTISRVLEVLGELDTTLVKLVDAELTTTLVLEDVFTGSIRTRIGIWLVPLLNPLVTGNLGVAVQELDVKKGIGAFVNKAIVRLIRFLENKQGLDNPEELRYLKDELDRLAREAAPNPLDAGSLHIGRLADEISNLTKAISALGPRDTMEYRSAQGNARFNPRFITDNLSQLAGAGLESSKQHHIRLLIKKPDYLGESRWELRDRHDHAIKAHITDTGWLTDFHAGRIDTRPGYLLEVDMTTEYVHIPNYKTAQVHYTITRVWQVISNAQLPPSTLFD